MKSIAAYMLTPEAFMGRFRPNVLSLLFRRQGRELVALETKPFDGIKKRSLDGTPYQYQLAISSTNPTKAAKVLLEANPGVATTTDPRSGILVFDGARIIASYMYVLGMRRLAVDPAYRDKGLAVRLAEQGLREVNLVWPEHRRTSLTAVAAGVALAAHRAVVEWAVSVGKSVPQEVLDAVDDSARAEALLARFSRNGLMGSLKARRLARRHAA